MTISTINRDLAFETFQYLPEDDVVDCGKVNKQWKKMVEENETKLFSKDFLAIKGAKDTFIRTRHLLEAVNREIAALEDFFADPENQVGLLEIGLSSFSFVNEECASYRDKMQVRAEKHALLGKLKSESYQLSCINRVELLTLKNFNNHPEMMKLFGGREEYIKLPIIDIRNIQPKRGPKKGSFEYLNCIRSIDMENENSKASIVRGFDLSEREFFTLKFKAVNDGKDMGGSYCATVHQCESGSDIWIHNLSEKPLPFDRKIIFAKSVPFFDPPNSKLAKLVSTGMLVNFETREVFFLA